VEPIKTRTNVVWLEDGIVRAKEDQDSESELQDAILLVENVRKLAGGARVPLIVDISAARSANREARAYFAGDEMAGAVTMMALVVGSALGRAIGSFFLSFNRPKFPVKLFSSVDDALAWVRSQAAAG
jgi:hypothetical protein